MHPNHLDKLNIRRRAGSTDDINARWHTLTGLCFLMQFFCQLRHARQDGALRSTKIEDSGNRLRERPRSGAENSTTPPDSVRPYSAYTTPTFACSASGNIFATTRRIPDHGVAFLLQAFGDAQLHQPAVAAQHHRLLTQFFAHRRSAASAARSSLVSSQRASITSLANWINAEQRCSGLSSVRRSLA